jgi:hypothetical protein
LGNAVPQEAQALMPADLPSIRHQLAVLARRKRARVIDRPNRWRPHEVICPETGEPYTDAGAWEFIADLLEQGHELEESPQEQPAGVTAYVMHVSIAAETLYIKVRLGTGCILGRSFHRSDKTGAT